jgi:hypothetical protein
MGVNHGPLSSDDAQELFQGIGGAIIPCYGRGMPGVGSQKLCFGCGRVVCNRCFQDGGHSNYSPDARCNFPCAEGGGP